MTATASHLRLATGRGGRAESYIEPLMEGAPTAAHLVVGRNQPESSDQHSVAEVDGAVTVTGIRAACDVGVPVVLEIHAWGADASGGLASTTSWGSVARALADASGMIPLLAIVDGPCLGGTALLLGLMDLVIVTDRARAHVSSTQSVERLTGAVVDAERFAGPGMLTTEAGVAHLHVIDLANALDLAADLLGLLPPNTQELPTRRTTADPAERACLRAAAAVPREARFAYDVRDVIRDVIDDCDLIELHARFAPTVVVGLARIDGHSIGVIANQPSVLAGALDIESSQKAARFVRFCDAFNVPLITFVDTPGFRPGRDQEWLGMIRHGAQLAFAYAQATVPRVCVILRKAYGGAYIVMDAKSMGNDLCVAWPGAEIAVMGAAGAVGVLHRRTLDALAPTDRAAMRDQLMADYDATFLTPRLALERGYVDEVIEPGATRSLLAGALAAYATKRERLPRRRHANTPL